MSISIGDENQSNAKQQKAAHLSAATELLSIRVMRWAKQIFFGTSDHRKMFDIVVPM